MIRLIAGHHHFLKLVSRLEDSGNDSHKSVKLVARRKKNGQTRSIQQAIFSLRRCLCLEKTKISLTGAF